MRMCSVSLMLRNNKQIANILLHAFNKASTSRNFDPIYLFLFKKKRNAILQLY